MVEVVQFKARQKTPAGTRQDRWIARVSYKTELGSSVQEHRFEEIEELHEIIERGPNFYCVEGIAIMLNPHVMPDYRPTIEAAERE